MAKILCRFVEMKNERGVNKKTLIIWKTIIKSQHKIANWSRIQKKNYSIFVHCLLLLFDSAWKCTKFDSQTEIR